MGNEYDAQVDRFVAECHRAGQHGLMLCSSGNMSWRFDSEHVLLSASRSWLPDISPDQVALVNLADGEVLNDCKPSVESRFHLGVLRENPETNVVLHYQSPQATALACRADEDALNYFVTPEIPFYIGPIAEVPYLPPGSDELAEAVIDGLRTHGAVMLRNHGQVTVGRDFDDAIQRAVLLELACGILLNGGRAMSDDAAANLRAAALSSGYGPV